MSRLVSEGGVATLRILLEHIARGNDNLLKELHAEAAHRDGFRELWRLCDLGEPPKYSDSERSPAS